MATKDTTGSGERFTGHGSEWRDSKLGREEALVATAWVEQTITSAPC